MQTVTHKSNKLVHEKSPYLLQHANNPVDWYPWRQEAFDTATSHNKPIFLSIGYSTCHWCHVMERESFEDAEVAELLNRYFISIKVDREERPDVDHIYMEFCQALTGSGGWPLTILMTPEKKPFFAGTYFPKNQRYGRPGMIELLNQVGSLWQTDEAKLRRSAEEIVTALRSHHYEVKTEAESPQEEEKAIPFVTPLKSKLPGLQDWGKTILDDAYQIFAKTFDSRYGGFGRAPKFPTPHNLGFLLRYAIDHPDSSALAMVRKTLDGMAQGGMYDHIGFGFARYSTDEMWLVPHFEKMLYDNALLAYVYLESYQYSHHESDARIAKEIFTYVLRDMTAPEGGFYSAEDADSEGEEGKFYVWTPADILRILGEEEGTLFCAAYNITLQGNFEGKSIPTLLSGTANWEKIATEHNLTLDTMHSRLAASRQILFKARNERIHPHKDDKILTAWNGLMIAALAKGFQVLGNIDFLKAAERAANFLQAKLRRPDGRLLARYREGEAALLGYLDDYAFYIWGLLELYSAGGKPDYLKSAIELQEEQERIFSDDVGGGYFLTGIDAEELLFRPKESYDGALPSGNSVSALNLLRLGRLTGEQKWENKADQLNTSWQEIVSAYPSGYTVFLQALQFAMHPSQELILAGSLETREHTAMRQTFFKGFHPYSTVLYQEGTVQQYIPWVRDYPLEINKVKAYLCQDFACQNPVSSPEELQSQLMSAHLENESAPSPFKVE